MTALIRVAKQRRFKRAVSRQGELADGSVGKLPLEEVLTVGPTDCTGHFRDETMRDECNNFSLVRRVHIAQPFRDSIEYFINRFSFRRS